MKDKMTMRLSSRFIIVSSITIVSTMVGNWFWNIDWYNEWYDQCIDNNIQTPTLTWEYWQPDGWENLTWPYLDVQTIQIQELQKENSRLKEAVRSAESKLRIQNLCGDMECWSVVWFINWYTISSWRVVYYSRDEILQWEIWSYEIQTEAQYNDKEYYWFERILPKSHMYNSKNELLKTIKWM